MSINKEHDIFFTDDFEVTYEEEITDIQADINNDAYKDALSALSELDDTHSFDYLKANRTRTMRIEEVEEYLKRHQEFQQNESKTPFGKAIDSCKKFIHTITPGKK